MGRTFRGVSMRARKVELYPGISSEVQVKRSEAETAVPPVSPLLVGDLMAGAIGELYRSVSLPMAKTLWTNSSQKAILAPN